MIKPYINEDNSCNLPYVVSTDEFGCDVICFNNKSIPLNVRKSSLDYQLTIYENCFDEYDYSAYQITDKLYIIIKYQDYGNNIQGEFNIIDNGNIVNLSSFINDDNNVYSINFNENYVVLLKSDLDYYDKEIIEAYDIKYKKMIDCHNYDNVQGLMDNVVNKKRCSLDVIISILTGRILDNEGRLFNFLSFLNKCDINENNYKDYLLVSRDYILKLYPELSDLEFNIDEISKETTSYGLSYFTFNPIDSTIDNLSYKDDYVKAMYKK